MWDWLIVLVVAPFLFELVVFCVWIAAMVCYIGKPRKAKEGKNE